MHIDPLGSSLKVSFNATPVSPEYSFSPKRDQNVGRREHSKTGPKQCRLPLLQGHRPERGSDAQRQQFHPPTSVWDNFSLSPAPSASGPA